MEDFFDDNDLYEHYKINYHVSLFYYILFIFTIIKIMNYFPMRYLINARNY